MANFITNGGCINSHRWGSDPGVADTQPDWLAAEETSITNQVIGLDIILALSFDGDDMNLIAGDFQVRWRNVTDAGSMAVLAATGEMNWAADTALVNGDGVPNAEQWHPGNCSGMGVDGVLNDGLMREGANAIDLVDISDGEVHENWWAISTDDALNGKTYSFEIVETGQTSPYTNAAPLSATVAMVTGGDIDGITKDNTGSILGSCFVALFQKVEGGGPPHDYIFVASTTSHASTGAYNFPLLSVNEEFFVYFIKEDSPHVFDATDDVITPV